MYKIYLTNRSLNEATSYYIGLIEQSITLSGNESKRICQVSDIEVNDVIITLEAKDFFLISVLKPKNKKINWYQGITPEEAMMVYGNPLRKWLWEFFERYSLRKAALNLFVSRAMRLHYQLKYNYRKSNYLEIPCYNQAFQIDSVAYEGKYVKPTFAYIGSLSRWQCIHQVLAIYKEVEKSLPEAHLSIFTREVAEATALVEAYQLTSTTVKHVPLEVLSEALKPIKYGWLIRDNIAVNNVATPTKMNTYMANGLIPIYSDVVEAFKENIDLGVYGLKIQPEHSNHHVASSIIQYELGKVIKPEELGACYQHIFFKFYRDEIYTLKLGNILCEFRKK